MAERYFCMYIYFSLNIHTEILQVIQVMASDELIAFSLDIYLALEELNHIVELLVFYFL